MGNKPSSPSAREDANTTRRNNASSYPTEEISPSQSSLSRSRRGNANVAGNRRARSTSSPTHQMASNGSGENGSTEIINATPDVDIPCEEEAEVEDRPGEMSWYQMAKVCTLLWSISLLILWEIWVDQTFHPKFKIDNLEYSLEQDRQSLGRSCALYTLV